MFSATQTVSIHEPYTHQSRRRTTKHSRRLHIKRHRHRRARIRRALRRHTQPLRAPARAREPIPCRERRQRTRVAPRQIRRTQRLARRPIELLRERATARGVLGVDGDEPVGEGLDRGGEGRVGGGRGGVGAGCDGGEELAEECERGGCDLEGALRGPDGERVVELLGDGEGGEVPWVAVVVHVLGVPADGDCACGCDAVVQGVDGAEGVDVDFEVRERLVRAGLEGRGVTARGGVEGVDGREDRVGVLARAATASIGSDVPTAGVPVALKARKSMDVCAYTDDSDVPARSTGEDRPGCCMRQRPKSARASSPTQIPHATHGAVPQS